MRVQALLFVAVGVLSSANHAADFTVTRSDDPAVSAGFSGPCPVFQGCSLRQAVLMANARAGADRILLDRKTYSLTQTTMSSTIDGRTGPLWVTDSLSIVGASSALTRVRWNASHHLHQVFVTANLLNLEALSVADGRGEYGGCIRAQSDLNLRAVVVEGCRAINGGAIRLNLVTLAAPAVLTLRTATLRNNLASGYGGALEMSGATTIIADGAQILGNTANSGGGAISINGSVGFSSTDPVVWRNDGAESQIADNSAGGNGGAILISSNYRLNMFVFPASGPQIVFARNVAVGNGGAISVGNYSGSGPRLSLEGVRFDDNAAAAGGAIAARGGLFIISSEFNRNVAQNAGGGALQLDLGTSGNLGSNDIRQTSFNQNRAISNGGAINNDCQGLNLRDVSLYNNSVGSGDGAAIASSGNTFLAHVSTDAHSLAPTPTAPLTKSALLKTFHTFCGGQPFGLANSLIAGNDRCYSPTYGTFSSNGGNQYGPGSGGCYLLAGLDQFQANPSVFALSWNTFGGVRKVLGWTNDGLPRPQVNFGQPVYCSTQDVRGLPRNDGACDAGAFEQQ